MVFFFDFYMNYFRKIVSFTVVMLCLYTSHYFPEGNPDLIQSNLLLGICLWVILFYFILLDCALGLFLLWGLRVLPVFYSPPLPLFFMITDYEIILVVKRLRLSVIGICGFCASVHRFTLACCPNPPIVAFTMMYVALINIRSAKWMFLVQVVQFFRHIADGFRWVECPSWFGLNVPVVRPRLAICVPCEAPTYSIIFVWVWSWFFSNTFYMDANQPYEGRTLGAIGSIWLAVVLHKCWRPFISLLGFYFGCLGICMHDTGSLKTILRAISL